MSREIGIIGYPLGHSVSPAMQQAAFDFYQMDIKYMKWETPSEDLSQRMDLIRDGTILGANITIPYKEAVEEYLDEEDEIARQIGAVNTVVNNDGLLIGYNTDLIGFQRALREDAQFEAKGKHVLLLGAGGVARAVVIGLVHEKIGSITIANRTLSKASQLVESLEGSFPKRVISSDFSGVSREENWDLIINCTSIGMKHTNSEGFMPMPGRFIRSDTLIYDLIYNPPDTPFLIAAKQAKAFTMGGLSMLVYQGAEAFKLWTGYEAPISRMFNAAYKALGYTV